VSSLSPSKRRSSSSCPVDRVEAFARTIPTDQPESDGTLEWDSTTIVVVRVFAGDEAGLGYTYTHDAAVRLIEDKLAPAVRGVDVETDMTRVWHEMGALLRNVGRPGMGFMALSAVDIALWDLRARLVGQPLVDVLGGVRDEAAVYGSGGFTSYSLERLAAQLGGWVAQGIPRVKMKVGRSPEDDPERLDAARLAIGDTTELFVDANGAFDRDDAVGWANRYANDWGVTWFEEPVSSADADGLLHVREHSPPQLDVAAGEYAYVPADVLNLLRADAVDCLQLDVTRCGGYTGFLNASGLAEQYGLQISAHCAPQVSAHVCCAVPHFRHIEYFHDHIRVERELFDGVLEPENGALRPDRSRAGHGLALKA
jgi:L-alanine-DL-glutamate epimerase-like enolase superfamily enzyme